MPKTSSHLVVFVSLTGLAAPFALLSPSAAAEPTTPNPALVCTAERRQLEARTQELNACVQQHQTVEGLRTQCTEDLQKSNRQLKSALRVLQTSDDERDALCTASGALVAGVLDGRSALPSLGACASEDATRGLGELVKSWQDSRAALGSFAQWSSGESDAWPVAPPLGGGPSATVRRLMGAARWEPPLPYRRLLVEAVRAVAPSFLKQLRAGGANALDDWFDSGAELEPSFVSEAESVLSSRGPAAGPSQSAALRLVQSFRHVAGCEQRPGVRECQRARRLQTFLESSASLIVRQRVHEIWVQPCTEVKPKSVLGWLREFPSSQSTVGEADWDEVVDAAFAKLVSCHWASVNEPTRFSLWFSERLPDLNELTAKGLRDVDALRAKLLPGSMQAQCLDALHSLRVMPTPASCALPQPMADRLATWFAQSSTAEAGAEGLLTQACAHYVRALWSGDEARALGSYPRPPSAQTLVQVDKSQAFRPTKTLRILCETRVGSIQNFSDNLLRVAKVASAAGEDTSKAPWRMSTTGDVAEETARHAQALPFPAWFWYRVRGERPCDVLGLDAQTCRLCERGGASKRFDCALLGSLKSRWQRLGRVAYGAGGGLIVLVVGLLWSLHMGRALRAFGSWRRELRGHLLNMGLSVAADGKRFLFPSRMGSLLVNLPTDAAWERWGLRAVMTRAEVGSVVTARDVTRAALAARVQGAELAVLCHHEGASPDLGAVRAILDWAARGPRKAMQILPISDERLRWIRTEGDLLDLIEQTSLRGNPFEVRGRLVSSSQFFNRERLVSGLLSACEAGHWTTITGLRRFGKSSLALEVARRLQGAYAYVDLAGFHHEVSSATDPSEAVDGILRYICEQFRHSARTIHGDIELPSVPGPEERIEAGLLAMWMRSLVAACRKANGDRPVNLLLILDEVEQAIGVTPERIGNAVDVVSVLVGRLRAVLNDVHMVQGGDRVGVIFCSALHPLLWAPLTTLSSQSLLGAFPSVFVPRLPDEAAYAMMRGLGSRQGIRFTDAALALIIREAQGIPILVRRIGSAVLELYDPERARQGSLGAVEIGVEGATAAVRREEEDGAPLRVWVESEIGDPHNPAGVLLRALARAGRMTVAELQQVAAEVTREQFVATGLAKLFSQEEMQRRSVEASGYIIRMLAEIGILETEGDQNQPDAFIFPESIVRRILASSRTDSLMGF